MLSLRADERSGLGRLIGWLAKLHQQLLTWLGLAQPAVEAIPEIGDGDFFDGDAPGATGAATAPGASGPGRGVAALGEGVGGRERLPGVGGESTMRSIAGGQAIIPQPLDPFLAGTGTAALPGRSPTAPLEPDERLWIKEFLVENLRGPEGEPPEKPLDLSPLDFFTPGTLPASEPIYKALLHKVYDRHKQHLLQRLREEPLFAYARQQWRQSLHARASNLEIAYAVFDRISRLMGTIYDFDPAPMAHKPNLGGYLGVYDFDAGVLFISERHMGSTAAELMDTIAHEQIHRFHHVMLHKLAQGELTDPEVISLALYWKQEEARRRPFSGLELGTEYHAYDVGGEVGNLIRTLPRLAY